MAATKTPARRPLHQINADIARLKGIHNQLFAKVFDEERKLRTAQAQWDNAKALRLAQARLLDPTGTSANPYLAGIDTMPSRPVATEQFERNTKALHSLAYVIAEREAERDSYSLVEQRMMDSQERLAAGNVLAEIAESCLESQAAPSDEEILRRAGIDIGTAGEGGRNG